MSVRNSFASLDESDDDEPRQQVKNNNKVKAKAKTPPATAPARNNNRGGRRDDNNRRDNRGGGRRGEYNRDAGDSNSRKYRRDDRRTDRRDDRRTDRRRDADRRDRRRDGNNNQERRGRNQYEKTHQKRGPKKAGHGGWGTDKDAVDVAEEDSPAAADTPTEEPDEETPSEPAAPAVRELTLEEHEAAEKERRAKFNERWGSKSKAASVDVEKEFSGMTVMSKKAWAKSDTSKAAKKPSKTASKSARKAKELKKAIFAEPTHDGYGRGYSPRSEGRGRGGRGRGGGRGGRREFSEDRDYGRGGGYNRRGGRGGRGAGRDNRQRADVNTQDVNEFPALA